MAGYQVSYKVLTEQGEALRSLAKQLDGYAARVESIQGNLGDGDLLLSVRQNLSKLKEQLGESRVALHLAGEVLTQCMEGYSSTEKTVVKKVDSVRAHNRDFYKNPVAVASAGVAGGASGVVAATAAAASVSGAATVSAPSAEAAAKAADAAAGTANPDAGVNTAGAALGGGFAGMAAGVGSVLGTQKWRRKDSVKSEKKQNDSSPGSVPEEADSIPESGFPSPEPGRSSIPGPDAERWPAAEPL